jgi:GTPase SAR1 family protein
MWLHCIIVLINETTLFWKFSGFNVETVEYKNISFTVWDVGGQDKVIESAYS